MDILSKQQRSERMRLIRAFDTKPEIAIRKALSGMGYRYRLHSSRLPGRPDIVFSGKQKVIFIHGCFWHRHSNCRLARMPKSKLEYWEKKLTDNKMRDARNKRRLKKLGWDVLIVWECQQARPKELQERLKQFLRADSKAKRKPLLHVD